MTPYGQILQLHHEGLNNSAIARQVSATRKTVIDVIKRAGEHRLSHEMSQRMSDTEIHRMLHQKAGKDERMPDLDRCFYCLGFPDKSIAGLWREYSADCRVEGVKPYSKSMFQNIIAEERGKYERHFEPTIELLYIKNAFVENKTPSSFLFCRHRDSDYITFVRVPDQKTRSWVHSIIHVIRLLDVSADECVYLGRISSKVRAETKNCLSYYGIRLTEKNGEKGTNELRNWVSEALKAVNACGDEESKIYRLRMECERHNKQPYFHSSSFTCDDAHQIAVSESYPLPDADYDLVEYTEVKPYINFHVRIDGVFYSVPFEFRHDKLTAYISDKLIEIYYGDAVIAVHDVINNPNRRYSTDPSHLPEDKDIPFHETSGRSLRAWARSIGPYTEKTIDKWLRSRQYEAQAYIMCNTLLHMSDRHERKKLEEACRDAWEVGNVSYRSIVKLVEQISD